MLSCLGLALHPSPALMIRTGLWWVSAEHPACGLQRPVLPPRRTTCCSSLDLSLGKLKIVLCRWPAGRAPPAQQAGHWTGRQGLHLGPTGCPLASPLQTQMTAAVSALSFSPYLHWHGCCNLECHESVRHSSVRHDSRPATGRSQQGSAVGANECGGFSLLLCVQPH